MDIVVVVDVPVLVYSAHGSMIGSPKWLFCVTKEAVLQSTARQSFALTQISFLFPTVEFSRRLRQGKDRTDATVDFSMRIRPRLSIFSKRLHIFFLPMRH